MIALSHLTEMLGWALVINIGFLILSTILLITMKPFVLSIHSKMFTIAENDLLLIYFKYLAYYKMLTFVFIASPYIALKIME